VIEWIGTPSVDTASTDAPAGRGPGRQEPTITSRTPTIAQLRAFAAVAQRLHFRDAAADLGMSQPALSGAVAALEEGLGARLVERTTRRVLLTRSGELVAQRARQVLAAVDDLVEAAQRGGGPFTGGLQLGVIPTVAPYLLPAVLRPVREAYPALDPIVHEQQTRAILDGLAVGRLDAAVLAAPLGAPLEAPGLVGLPLYDEDFVLVFPAGHPRPAGAVMAVADLRGMPVLLMDEGHCLRDQALAVCREAGAAPDPPGPDGAPGLDGMRAASPATLVQLVAGGLGVTLLPSSAAAVETRRGSGLATARFSDPAPGRSIVLAYRASSPRAREFGQLAGTVRGAVRSHRLPVRVSERDLFAEAEPV
jgi:LysR family transcriptional regulator, hydrogen peroxide-inducible genes activator